MFFSRGHPTHSLPTAPARLLFLRLSTLRAPPRIQEVDSCHRTAGFSRHSNSFPAIGAAYRMVVVRKLFTFLFFVV